MKSKQKLLYSSILIGSLIFAGCGQQNTEEGNVQDVADTTTEVQAEIFYVKSESVSKQSFDDQLILPGQAEPIKTVVVTAKTAGDVKSASYDIGDKIEKNTLLMKLDDQNHRIALNSAKLGLDQAKITLDTAKDNLEKNRALYDSGAISKTNLDSLENAFKGATIGYQTAKNSYDTAKINLDNTTIESPISGVIAKKNFAIGENINPGKEIYTVVNTDQIHVIVGVPEQYIHGLKKEQEVSLSPQFGDSQWDGKVINISPIMDERSHTYTTKILVDNMDGNLRAGMSLDVVINIGDKKEELAFNKLGLILEEENTYVYLNDNGKAKMVPVTIGISNDHYYEILDGLSLGDEVITEGSGMLSNGDLVEIKN